MPRMLTCLLALMFAAAPAAAAPKGGTLGKIAKTGVFTIGYRTDSPPFSFVDTSEGPSGYSVDLCRRIATAVKEHLKLDGMKIEYLALSSEERMDAVIDGKVDIECGSSTITLSRQEQVDFTLMIFVTGGSLLTLKESGVRSTGDLAGKSVAVIENTTTQAALDTHLGASLIDAQVVNVASRDDAMAKLDSGQVDAFASDQIVLIGQIMQSGQRGKYAIADDIFSYEPYGLMVRRNDADFRLVANRALARIYRTEQYKQIYTKWFGRAGLAPTPVLIAMYTVQALPE